jgi:hypothetical protein
MTFASLAPAWAAVVNDTQGVTGWVVLCAADGAKRVAINANGDPVSPETSTHQTSGEHCPYCHIQPPSAVLPPAWVPAVPQTLADAEFPALFYAAALPAHAWAPTRSRAPPTRS